MSHQVQFASPLGAVFISRNILRLTCEKRAARHCRCSKESGLEESTTRGSRAIQYEDVSAASSILGKQLGNHREILKPVGIGFDGRVSRFKSVTKG